jgi:Fe-S cluster assembly scaffold protein SufB
VLKLIQIERLGNGYTFLNDIGGRVENSGRVELIHLVLDGGHTYLGVQIDLAGYKSALKADIGYRVGGDHTLDINYFANHTGKKTTCDINAKGVLRDHARKVFRGTIDLKKGSSGSVGNEKEDVLMMDDTVRNQTLPVILCTEEDVVGNHGATIGRLDESVLFYLQSRGMDREAVYEMMADARVASVVHLIEDERTRAEAERYLGGISDSVEE